MYIAIGCGALALLGLVAGGIATWYFTKKAKEFAGNPAYATLRLAVAANPDLETVASDDKTGHITVKDKRTGQVTTLDISSMKDGTLRIGGDGGEMVLGGGADGKGQLTIRGKDGSLLVAKGGPQGGSLVVAGADGKVASVTGAAQGGIVVTGPEGTARVEGAPGGGKLHVVGPKGEFQMGEGAGGPQPPAWLPLYPGAVRGAGMAMLNEEGDERTGAFTYETADPIGKVLDTYEATLKGAGLPTKSKMQTDQGGQPSGVLVAGPEDDSKVVTILLAPQGGKTTITISFTEKKTK